MQDNTDNSKTKTSRTLPVVTPKEAARKAKEYIQQEAKMQQLGLLSRWPALNRSMGKYFRWGQIIGMAGMSGSGKSYILTLLYRDFLNMNLNRNYKGKKFVIIHFGYEMFASDEMIRMVTGDLQTSYRALTSSEYGEDDKPIPISDEMIERAMKALDELAKAPIYFIESAGNVKLMKNTLNNAVHSIAERIAGGKIEDIRIIVGIDHTLLVPKLDEKDEIELVVSVSKFCMEIKKQYNAMVIPLAQLNGNIETENRRSEKNPFLHYPVKTDIHGSNQFFHAVDSLMIWHRPELLHIPRYGVRKIPTSGIIHGLLIKSRFGTTGSIWLKNNLNKGTIDTLDLKQLQQD